MAILPDFGLMTVDEYHRLCEEGVLDEDARVELVDGRIVEMPPIGPRHLFNVNRLNQLFMLRLLGRIILSIQNPVTFETISRSARATPPRPSAVLCAA